MNCLHVIRALPTHTNSIVEQHIRHHTLVPSHNRYLGYETTDSNLLTELPR